MRISILILLIALLAGSITAQEFEYVYNQHERSTMNDAVRLGDKIVVAANIGGCSNAGYLVFDTLGSLLREEILHGYFSVSPSLTLSADGTQVLLLSYVNESEELYDTTQFFLYAIDTAGNSKMVFSEASIEFGRGSLFINDFAIVFDDAAQLLFLYPELGSLATKNFSDVFGDRYIDVMQAGEDWIVYADETALLNDRYVQKIDTVLIYRGHPLFDNEEVTILSLSRPATSLHALDSQLLAVGEDKILRLYDINTGMYDSLEVGAGILDIQFNTVGEQLYMLSQNDDNFTFSPVQIDPLAVEDPLWSVEEKVYDWRLVAGEKYLTLLSSLVFTDHSYRQISFAAIRRMVPLSFPERSEFDIAVLDLEILDSLSHGNCDELHCEFDREAPAIAKVTIKNVGDLPVENFAFYGKSLGGSFCVSFRTSTYYEVDLMPGETFVIYDSIYPIGPVRDIDYYAHVQVPNHRLEMDTSNNFLRAELFTTPTIDWSFEKLDVFPNPTMHFLEVSGISLPSQGHLRIYQLNGLLVSALPWNHQPIPISDLDPGIYLLQLQDDHRILSARFVKQ